MDIYLHKPLNRLRRVLMQRKRARMELSTEPAISIPGPLNQWTLPSIVDGPRFAPVDLTCFDTVDCIAPVHAILALRL